MTKSTHDSTCGSTGNTNQNNVSNGDNNVENIVNNQNGDNSLSSDKTLPDQKNASSSHDSQLPTTAENSNESVPGSSSTSGATDQTPTRASGDLPQTGESSNYLMLIGFVLIFACGIFMLRRIKK